jgi:hypothetical protein
MKSCKEGRHEIVVKVKHKGMLCRGKAEVTRDGNNRVGEARRKTAAIFLFYDHESILLLRESKIRLLEVSLTLMWQLLSQMTGHSC